jgi:hypothetical protein
MLSMVMDIVFRERGRAADDRLHISLRAMDIIEKYELFSQQPQP